MRPFRSEDEGLLFGVAKLAFADCDDGRTIATLERDTVFVAELAGQPAGYVALEESAERSASNSSVCTPPMRRKASTSSCSTGPRATRSRRFATRSRSSWSWERPRPRVLPQPRVRPRRAGSPRARPAAGSVASPSSSCPLALPGGGVRARAPRRLETGGRRRARDRADDGHAPLRRRGPAGGGERGRRRARPLGARRRRPAADVALARPAASSRPPARRVQRPLAGRLERRPPVSGVLAFAVGAGSARPVSILAAENGMSTAAILLRLLFLAGVLVAGGAALTGARLGGLALGRPGRARSRRGRRLRPRRLRARRRRDALRPGHGDRGDRRARRRRRGARRDRDPDAPLAAAAIGVLVLAAPTLAGHALDPHRLRWLVALADVAHVAGAAVWIGGLTLLVARTRAAATASRRSRSQRSPCSPARRSHARLQRSRRSTRSSTRATARR